MKKGGIIPSPREVHRIRVPHRSSRARQEHRRGLEGYDQPGVWRRSSDPIGCVLACAPLRGEVAAEDSERARRMAPKFVWQEGVWDHPEFQIRNGGWLHGALGHGRGQSMQVKGSLQLEAPAAGSCRSDCTSCLQASREDIEVKRHTLAC